MRPKSDLRPYQQRVATELYNHDERLVVIRPGGGKTCAALTAIQELILDGVIRHALVIAPKRVARSVWPDEIVAWEHTQNLPWNLLDGSPADRRAWLRMDGPHKITLIGIDLVQWLMEELDTVPSDSPLFDLLVLDEVSKLRDPTGKRAKELARRADRWKMIWGLSGTLRPSGPLDLFMPSRIVTRSKLWGKSFYKWRDANFYPTDYMKYNWAALPGAEDKLNAELAPWTVTLAENEMPQLPPLQIILDHIELPEDARRAYYSMEDQLVTGDIVAASAAVATGKLAQISNGFIYGRNGTMYEDMSHRVHEEKSGWLRDLIDQASGPTLLIYEFIEDLRLMEQTIPGLSHLGEGASDDETIRLWNAGKLPFLALHPASGGHGLNLQHGGCDMAWISPTWSPELWEQTIARLHRSGQTKPVVVRVCVARDTVDQMKLDRVHGKMSAQAAFEAYLRRHHELA